MIDGTLLPQELRLTQRNEIPVLELNHAVGQAQISLQGAQLLSWKPRNQLEMLWLSEIEPFQLGNAIRGGIPICYPWFGSARKPAHGTARIRLWKLSSYDIQANKVSLTFTLLAENNQPEAQIQMTFNDSLQLTFTNLADESAEAALHTYFRVGDIHQAEIQGLPTECFNKLTEQTETVASPRKITQAVDSIYNFANNPTVLVDNNLQRKVTITHHQASNIVVWNPWKETPSAMRLQDYQQMICIETARILDSKLNKGESVSVTIA